MAAAIPRHLLETLVNCPACSQRYNEPRVLPTCGHTVCKFELKNLKIEFNKYNIGSNCLENEWNQQEPSSLVDGDDGNLNHYCPVKNCRKEICSTIHNYTDLPINQTVLDLIGSCNFHVEAAGQCHVCNQSPSFVKCSHCSLFVCFECANQHRREAVATLTNSINTLEQEYLSMNDQIDHERQKLVETRQKSIDAIRSHYARLIEELRCAQITNEEIVERQSTICNNELELLIDEHKQRCDQINKSIQDLRVVITDWSTIEQFKQLELNLNHLQEDIREANEVFHERVPEMKIFEVDHDDYRKKIYNKHVDSPSHTDELIIMNRKQNIMTSTESTRLNQLDGV